MHIGIVGGIHRTFRLYEQAAAARGHVLSLHGGEMAGRGRDALETLVARSSLVVVVTDVNSHGAMFYVRRQARALGRPCVLVRRLGLRSFRKLLVELEGGRADEERCRRPGISRPAPKQLLASGW